MYGAIAGDIIGSPYEFDRGKKVKDFPLFSEKSKFTDDTVLTIAVCDGLLSFRSHFSIFIAVESALLKWGQKYPYAGYGRSFEFWLNDKNRHPYGSRGNGSAMRVSSVGWLYSDLETTRKVAHITASITHNSPEGVEGAEAVASSIYLARICRDKDVIRDYLTNNFHYTLTDSIDVIRPDFFHQELSRVTVPAAITAFLEGENFEDVIRNAISLGGDCDTVACIAGSIAEAYYGIPENIKEECLKRIPCDMQKVLTRFNKIRQPTKNQ